MTSQPPVETNEWRRSPRRIRVRLGEVWVADSTRAMLLRQHGFLPVYYFPARDVRRDLFVPTDYTTHSPYKGDATYWHLRAGERTARFAVWSYARPKPGSPDTRDYYGFDWHSMDEWYEEDERVHVHARDPMVRVDALRSSRRVRVEIAGTTIAESGRPVLLFETGLVTRYYLPPADVRQELLSPSPTFTMCPYKGRARYYHLDLDGARFEDVASSTPARCPRWRRSPDTWRSGTSASTRRFTSTASRRKGSGCARAAPAGSCSRPGTSTGPSLLRPRCRAPRRPDGRSPPRVPTVGRRGRPTT